jgi:hypothetical protein
MNGSIVKLQCDPYLYKTTEGEEIELTFTYEYSEESGSFSEAVLG